MGVFDAFRRDMQNFSVINEFKNLTSESPREQKSGLERIKDNILTTIGDVMSFGLDRKVKKNFDENARYNRELFNSEIARADAEVAAQNADAVKFDAQFAKENKGN